MHGTAVIGICRVEITRAVCAHPAAKAALWWRLLAQRLAAKSWRLVTVAWYASGMCAGNIMSAAWQAPGTVRRLAATPARLKLLVVGDALVAKQIQLVDGDEMRRQSG